MDAQEKSFDLVQESSRLLVTLATGFIAFSVTFSTELDGFSLVSYWEKWTWSLSWLFMLISVACGAWTLLGLTTVLAPSTQSQDYKPTIRDKKVKVPFAIQIIAFGISAMFMVLYGLGEVF